MTQAEQLYNKFMSGLPDIKTQGNDLCWPWMGSRGGDDQYGVIKLNDHTYMAHRVSYTIFNGEISEGLIIRHTCDNPCCVNPRHLLSGTASENALDAYIRNRQPRVRLNEEAVKVIRWMFKHRPKKGLAAKLALFYKIDESLIYSVKMNRTWKRVIIE